MELLFANASRKIVTAISEGQFDYTVCVGLLNDKVSGFVAYSEDELAWLYVDPVCSRQGIGRVWLTMYLRAS